MTRCIFILGTLRSGTTAVAGILNTLGADMMGAHPLPPMPPLYPKGFFEDGNITALNGWAIGERGRPLGWLSPIPMLDEGTRAAYKHFLGIRERDAGDLIGLGEGTGLWGIKDPRLCFTAQFVEPMLASEIRAISVDRPLGDSAASVQEFVAYLGGDVDAAFALRAVEGYVKARDEWLESFGGAVETVAFADLLDDPKATVGRLADFAYDGIAVPPRELVAAATAFCDGDVEAWGL